MRIDEVIVKQGDQWCVKSKKKDRQGHRKNLGCYDSRTGAERRLGQVEYFKHLEEAHYIPFYAAWGWITPDGVCVDATDQDGHHADIVRRVTKSKIKTEETALKQGWTRWLLNTGNNRLLSDGLFFEMHKTQPMSVLIFRTLKTIVEDHFNAKNFYFDGKEQIETEDPNLFIKKLRHYQRKHSIAESFTKGFAVIEGTQYENQ